MLIKFILSGEDARLKILEGINKLDDAVSSSLGPRGLNAIIEAKHSAPKIINDGVTIARHFRLEDKTADLSAQAVINSAMKTNSRVGDGTTTTVLLACTIVKNCFEKMQLGSMTLNSDPISMSVEIARSAKRAIEILNGKAKPFEGSVLRNILSTSLRDVDYIDQLAKMIEEVGKDGYISVEDNWATQDETTFETTVGMKFYGSYLSPFMLSNSKGEAIMEESSVFITNHQIEHLKMIDPIFVEMKKIGKTKLVLIATNYARPALVALSLAAQQYAKGDPNIMQVLAIKAPSLTSNEMEDIEAFTGGKFITSDVYKNLSDFFVTANTYGKLDYLGYAKKVIADKDNIKMIGGAGNVTARLMVLQSEQENEKDEMFKEKRKRRIANLASGVGIIRVGAATEPERMYIKLKLEDAVCAARAAMEEGYVKGGGIALKEIAEELGQDNILYKALISPYEKIQSDYAGGLEIPDHVIDPVKVLRIALENACSVAGKLITVYSTNADKTRSLWDDLEEKMRPSYDSDFRANENQDLGAGRLIE